MPHFVNRSTAHRRFQQRNLQRRHAHNNDSLCNCLAFVVIYVIFFIIFSSKKYFVIINILIFILAISCCCYFIDIERHRNLIIENNQDIFVNADIVDNLHIDHTAVPAEVVETIPDNIYIHQVYPDEMYSTETITAVPVSPSNIHYISQDQSIIATPIEN